MTREGWDEIATWRNRRMGERGDLWHRSILDPTLLHVVGPVRGLRVLDLGCGNGYLARRWARAGAVEVVGVDASEPTLKGARARERAHPTGARFVRHDAARMSSLTDGHFDLIVAHMSLMDIANGRGTIREVGRLLAPTGRFVFSIAHPCFDVDLRSMWVVEHGVSHDTVFRKVTGYRKEHELEVPWRVSATKVRYTRSYHRPLPTYFRYLRDAGLAVTLMEEPLPGPEALRSSPQADLMLEIPLHLIVEAVPLPAGTRTAVRRPGSRTSARTRGRGGRRSGSNARTPGTGSRRRGSTPGS
jgi:SAM-dependent methyltransferase